MKKLLVVGIFLNAGSLAVLTTSVWHIVQGAGGGAGGPACATVNGDVNGDGGRNIADPIYLLNWLFSNGPDPVELCVAQGGDLESRVSDLEATVLELQVPKIPGFTYVETNKSTGLHEYTHEQTGIEFVLLPGGVSNMGSPDNEPGRNSIEGPIHPVSLSPFLCAKHEVTQGVWLAVMGSNPSSFTGDDNRPVESVSWDDIQEFERRTGLVLPTEAQWEYACRAGQAGPYSGTGNLDDMGWHLDNSGSTTHPVGEKAPNQFGLHDMHGNVWEWCEDVLNDAFYTNHIVGGTAPGNAALDPLSLAGSGRVFRGGSWRLNSEDCRSASRNGSAPSFRLFSLGFRPVRSSISP